MHDEVLVEVADNSDGGAHAEQIRQLMIAAMREVVPTVRIDVKYSATRRWYKKAQPLRDSNTGALQLWDPSVEEAQGK